MYYFVSLSMERFYADTLVRGDAKLADKPLIVHHEKQVLDLNSVAEASGARVGMALSEAKALLRDGCFVRWEEEPYRETQEAWLQLCADFTDTIEPEQQHSAYLDFSQHPEIDSLVWRLQRRIFEELGWKSRTGVGCTKWIAKVAEMVNGDGELPCPYLEPCTHPIRFLSGLPTRYLLPVPETDRMRLRFLGYHKIGEVASVPLPALREQFGEEGLLVYQAAHGGVQQCVRAEYPRDSVATRFRFEGAVEDLQVLDEGMRLVAGQLSETLRVKDLQGSQLELAFEGEDGDVWKNIRKFMKPMQSGKAIYGGMKLISQCGEGQHQKAFDPPQHSIINTSPESPQPSNLKPLPLLITEIRARMSDLKPAERFQRELSGAHSAVERKSNTLSAFQHIRTVFGDHAIEVAGERKEPRRKQLLRFWKDATGWS
jgi:nucleotidyltransferase/DNA polymerase involved in DNA repair